MRSENVRSGKWGVGSEPESDELFCVPRALPETATMRVYSAKERFSDLHAGDSFMSRALGGGGAMREHSEDGPNIALLQLSVPLPLSIDIAYTTYVDSGIPSLADGARIMEAAMMHAGGRLTDMITVRRQVLSPLCIFWGRGF